MFGKRQPIVIIAVTLIVLAGCGATSPATSPLPTPEPPASQGQLLHEIAANPDKYVGRQVTVEGVLEAEGQMPQVRFFLRVGEDRLEVSAWAPLETFQPPQGTAAP